MPRCCRKKRCEAVVGELLRNEVIFCAESRNLLEVFPKPILCSENAATARQKGQKVQLYPIIDHQKNNGIEFRFAVAVFLSLLWLGVSFQLVAIPLA